MTPHTPPTRLSLSDRLAASERGGLAAHIGNTPLLPLHDLVGTEAARTGRVTLWGKAEYFNPGGSVKDRPALSILRDAIQRGVLTEEKRLLDATSGNTGIAYAMLGAALGVGVTLALPPQRLAGAEADFSRRTGPSWS